MACADSSKFSEPLPWIGIYIAAASLLCSFLMGLDTINGFRRRKLWFPCRFFSLNATSLTLLAIATKLPLDLDNSMPRSQDQLTKLSGTVLICTVMGNFLTSIGTMDESERTANVIALGILVVTVIVNIGIQVGTGVIYVFLPEHAILMFLMLLLLLIFCSTASVDRTPKKLLERKYRKILKSSGEFHFISDETDMKSDETHMGSDVASQIKKLRAKVEQYCMMVSTGNHQYVAARYPTCTASGAVCILSAFILLQAAVRSLIIRSVEFCEGKSDYKWSVTLVLISQAIAILVGTIAPATRSINAVSFRSPRSILFRFWRGRFITGNRWNLRLNKWKVRPLHFHIGNRRLRKIFLVSKITILNVFIAMQGAVIIVCSLITLTVIFPMSWLIRFFSYCNRPWKEEVKRSEMEPGSSKKKSLRQWMMTIGREDAQYWIHKGKKNQPIYLMELLKKFTVSQGFQGVVEFDENKVPSLVGTETRDPPNCWALPIVTLTSIAIAVAFPSVEESVRESLRRGVHEGLKYVRFIEEQLNTKSLIKAREAADIVWLGIDFDDHWLGKDIKKLALAEKSADRILEKLERIGYDHARCSSQNWSPKTFAGNSMHRLCQTIRQKGLQNEDLFARLQKVIADMLAACLSNLPLVISMKFSSLSIELREENIRDAAYLVGEVEEILIQLKIDQRPQNTTNIDDWVLNRWIIHSTSSSSNNPTCLSV